MPRFSPCVSDEYLQRIVIRIKGIGLGGLGQIVVDRVVPVVKITGQSRVLVVQVAEGHFGLGYASDSK